MVLKWIKNFVKGFERGRVYYPIPPIPPSNVITENKEHFKKLFERMDADAEKYQ